MNHFPTLPPDFIIEIKPDSTYSGSYNQGLYHGKGCLDTPSKGKKVEGKFIKGDLPFGKLTFCDGSYYIGQFKQLKAFGEGSYFKNRFSLETIWNNNGQPILKNVSLKFANGDTFDGCWKNHHYFRQGTFKHLNQEDGSYHEFKMFMQLHRRIVIKGDQEIRHFDEET